MNSYLSLVPISARMHRRQSRMTRVCIILAVFLVTSIFSMADMWIRAEQITMLRKHGNYHIALENVQENTAEQIRARSDVAASSSYLALGADPSSPYLVSGQHVAIYGIEKAYAENIMQFDTEGAYPENETEAVLSADAKELSGVQIGDTITLQTPAGDSAFTISGFYQDDSEWNGILDGFCIYISPSAMQSLCTQMGESCQLSYYIQFRDHTDVKVSIAEIKAQYALPDTCIEENTAVLGLTGASSQQSIRSIYPLAMICFVLILASGILMISSCMNSNVAQRTSFFGMLRCIGASKQQIARFVRLEALNWCKSAIPAGCLLGTVVCWILCAILRLLVQGEWADMPLFGVSISGIVSGVAVGIITVFLAAHSPARQAARVSPIAAVSGTGTNEASAKVSHAANTRLFKIETALGIQHASASRKNLFLMTGSFALTITLFLVFAACLDLVHRLLPSESSFSPDISISASSEDNSISPTLTEELRSMDGVRDAFGVMFDVSLPVEINGTERVIDLVSYDDFMFENTKKSIASGKLSKIYGDSDCVMTVFSDGESLDIGDKIQIGGETVEITAVASEGMGSVSGSPVVVCSEETFRRLTGDHGYYMVGVMLEKHVSEKTTAAIERLAGGNQFLDNRENDQEIHGSYLVFRFAAYGFLTIISLITVLNIMNSISMGVSSRIRQYGAMRAVGMDAAQIKKMIAAEAATYAVCGTAAGIGAGLLLHYLIYSRIIITHLGGVWQIPFSSIAVILLLVFVSCIAAVKAPAKRIRDMAITETINEL